MDLLFQFLGEFALLMGGSLWTAFVAFRRWRRGAEVTEHVLWPAVVCIILALASALVREHGMRVQAQADKPDFTGAVETIWVANTPNDIPELFMVIALKNLGLMPSVAEGWKIRLPTLNVETVPRYAPEREAVRDNNDNVMAVFLHDEALYVQTQNPIQRGKILRGWLHYRFEDTSYPALQTGPPFEITYKDILDREYTIKGQIPTGGKRLTPDQGPTELPPINNPFLRRE